MNRLFGVGYRFAATLSFCAAVIACGCGESSTTTTTTTRSDRPQAASKPESKPAVTEKSATSEKAATPSKAPAADKPATAEKKPESKSASAKREAFTAANNPTTKGGRGAPDLDKPQNPAAWVYIDGKPGKYKEEGGAQLLQWFLDDAVGATPKFRVEAYEPLLGTPKDFKAVLRTVESEDGSDLVYGIAAKEGTFEVGREYSLLNPGENFTIRNGANGDEVKEISPLPAGKYAFAAGVVNTSMGKQTLAVTYFTVKSDD